MADEVVDPRLESLLRAALVREIASLPLTVTPARILERAGTGRRANARRRLRGLLSEPPTIDLRQFAVAVGAVAVLAVAAAVALTFLANRPGVTGQPPPSDSTSPPPIQAPSSGPTYSPSSVPASEPPTSGFIWPQSNLEEVRQAQELADDGDPRYTWQVDPDLEARLSQGGPYRAEIFTRFLEEKLGWEEFQWTLGNGAYEGSVAFLRCEPGVTTVSPIGHVNIPCAPTIDELRYETVQIDVAQLDRQGPSGIWVVTNWEMLEPFEGTAPLVDLDIIELLTGFLEARVAGQGAEQYLGDEYGLTLGDDIPLLYATTSGIPYDDWAFEPVPGIEWPYGLTAFNVRLFAGDTVVEQLIFWSEEDSPLELTYVPDGFGTDIAPTTEDGRPVARPYSAFDGELTVHVAHPWVFRYGQTSIRLVPEGPGVVPTTDGGERNAWDRLVLMADPVRSGPGCPTGPRPANAEALAESIRSDPGLEATAPVALSTGGVEALMMDVAIAAGMFGACGGLYGNTELGVVESVGLATGNRMRLYLLDAPEGSSMRILAIAIVVPESRFESAVESARTIGIEFQAP